MKTIVLLSAAMFALALSGGANAELTSREIGWCVQSKEFAQLVTWRKDTGGQKAELHKQMSALEDSATNMTLTHGIINLVYDHGYTPDGVFNSCMLEFSKD